MARLDVHSMCLWITAAAVDHPHDLARHVAQRAGVGRPTAQRALQRLVDLQWLRNDGTARKPAHVPGLLRQVVRQYTLDGLEEDLPWAADFAPFVALPDSVRRMTQHAFTELLNNAVDHSGGTQVTVSLRQTPSHVQLLVSDNGRGVFDQIGSAFAITDPTLAMFELSKGKLTSAADRHSGRGLFFTSRMADVFDLHANDVAYRQLGWDATGWRPGRGIKHRGTSVFVSIALDTTRTLDGVLNDWSLDADGVGFDRTVVPLALMTSARVGLESRAQARRVASRLERFRRADIDFRGVGNIGHAFADELFRVQADRLLAAAGSTGEPVSLLPVNMSPAVAAMVRSVSRT